MDIVWLVSSFNVWHSWTLNFLELYNNQLFVSSVWSITLKIKIFYMQPTNESKNNLCTKQSVIKWTICCYFLVQLNETLCQSNLKMTCKNSYAPLLFRWSTKTGPLNCISYFVLTDTGVQINISPKASVDVPKPIEAPSDGILHRLHR